jgi:predicted alpha/beta superfamily hydrolase
VPHRIRPILATLRRAPHSLALLWGAWFGRRDPSSRVPTARQATLRLSSVPELPGDAAVYVAGSFNNWDPCHPDFKLTRERPGEYSFTLPGHIRGPILFKFTLGSWQSVETDTSGDSIPYRKFTVPLDGTAIYTATVGGWRNPQVARARAPSTATASVSVLDHVFLMPELERTRRILLYLPPDYATSDESYPVLYMQDGQNVFDATTSFAGEWGVDEELDGLHAHGDRGAIVVAIENGRLHRQDEYSPWRYADRFGGEGDAYVDFLANTLKPHIDRHYRTLPDRCNTAVMGSSMGGLITLYAALKYPEVFGLAGVFSPSLWAAPQLYDYARAFDPRRPHPRLYFVSGELEGPKPGGCTRNQERMIDALVATGFRLGHDIEVVLRKDGTHSEGFWRREFPAAYRWLLAQERESDGSTATPRLCGGSEATTRWLEGTPATLSPRVRPVPMAGARKGFCGTAGASLGHEGE